MRSVSVSRSLPRRLLALALLSSLVMGLGACTSAADTVIQTQTRVLQQDPGNVSALIDRGNAFRDKGDYVNALADHNRAIELSPTSARAFLGRGLDYLAQSNYEKAIEDLSKSITLNPELSEAYARRGEARVKLQTEYQAALNDFDKAISQGYTDTTQLQRYRGLALFRLGQTAQAIDAYLKAAASATESTPSAQRDAQIDALSEAIGLGIEDVRLYQRRAMLMRFRKSYDRAIEDLGAVIRLNSQQASAYEERADLYYTIGRCTLAEQDLRTACRLQNRKLCEAITLGCSSTPSPSPTPDDEDK